MDGNESTSAALEYASAGDVVVRDLDGNVLRTEPAYSRQELVAIVAAGNKKIRRRG